MTSFNTNASSQAKAPLNPKAVKETIGSDPRDFAREFWEEQGYEIASTMKAIRAKCLDCVYGSKHEVRLCQCTSCALYPLRMGYKPQSKGHCSYTNPDYPEVDASAEVVE